MHLKTAPVKSLCVTHSDTGCVGPCSLIKKNEGVEAAEFDPSLLLDQLSITILQHLLR